MTTTTSGSQSLSLRFDDQVALVVGGSSGIGAAAARLFGQLGATVVVAAPAGVDLNPTVRAVERAGGNASGLACDVTDRVQVTETFDQVLDRHGRVDVVVYSAGIIHPTPAFGTDPAHVDAIIAVNLVGAINVVHGALRVMRGVGGKIVVVSSTQARLAEPGTSVYAASKAGLEHFVASLAPDLKTSGIRVNCIAPGAVRTPMTAVVHDPATAEMRAVRDSMEKLGNSPSGRFWADPEDMAPTIAFLASDLSQMMQGTTLVADQGYTSALFGRPVLSDS